MKNWFSQEAMTDRRVTDSVAVMMSVSLYFLLPCRGLRRFLRTGAAVLFLMAAAGPALALESITGRDGGDAGLVVLVEPATPNLARELAAGGRHLVVALSADAGRVAHMDEAFTQAGVHPLADAMHWRNPDRLPFQSNAVNVLVVDRATATRLGDAEIQRALVPGYGFALVDGREVRKPRPEGMDVWLGWNANATGNRLSRDMLDPPNSIQWLGGRRGTPSNLHLVSDRVHLTHGRSTGLSRTYNVLHGTSPRDTHGRDAFSGVARWSMHHGMGGYWDWNRMVFTDGQRLFLPQPDAGTRSRSEGPRPLLMESRNLLTGEILQESLPLIQWSQRLERQEIRMGDWNMNNFLTLRVISDGTRVYQADGANTVRALNADATRKLWEVTFPKGEFTDMVATDGKVLAVVLASTDDNPVSSQRHFERSDNISKAIVALDPATGRQLWRYDGVKGFPLKYLIVDFGAVVAASHINDPQGAAPKASPGGRASHAQVANNMLVALDRDTGRERFRRQGAKDFMDVPHLSGQRASLSVSDRHIIYNESTVVYLFDLHTGKTLNSVKGRNFRHHTRWSANTLRWIIHKNVFLSYDGKVSDTTPAEISNEDYGGFSKPANGMFYITGGFAQASSPLHLGEVLALTREDNLPDMLPDNRRLLVTGQARGIREAAPADWPTFRGDFGRRAWKPVNGPAGELKPAWSATILTGRPEGALPYGWSMNSDSPGPITQPVADGQRVLVAVPDRHELVCLNLANGSVRWRTRFSGRVAAPPTLAGEVAFVGVNDGTVSAINLDDGSVIWTFLAAPYERLHNAHQQIESTHPVRSSPILLDGLLYVAAGRHGRADNGIFVWALDAATGQPRAWERVTGRQINDIMQVVAGRLRLTLTDFAPRTLAKSTADWDVAPYIAPASGTFGGHHGWIAPGYLFNGHAFQHPGKRGGDSDRTCMQQAAGGGGFVRPSGHGGGVSGATQRDDRFALFKGGSYEERSLQDSDQVLRRIRVTDGRFARSDSFENMAGSGRYHYLVARSDQRDTGRRIQVAVIDTKAETVAMTGVEIADAHEEVIPDGIAIAHGHVIITTTAGRVLAFTAP
jgi:outer membrane protein assembly factor BamB